VLITGTTLVVGAPMAAADEALRYEAHSTYTLDPAAGVVHVLVDMTLTNQKPSSTSGSYITSYYFDSVGVPILSSAANLRATRDGRELGVGVEGTGSDRFVLARVSLSPRLEYRDVARVQLTYDLVSQAPRSDATTRVNEAFATFVVFPVADPNLTSVRILIPDEFDVEYVGSPLREKQQGDMQLFESGAIADPLEWGAVVSARDDKKLAADRGDINGHDVEIRAWPDDAKWGRFVRRQLRSGLPVLEDLVGQPFTNDSKLRITETVSPYLYGYAGWYSSFDNTIEIGDALDAEVVLHEVSHIWFNEQLFADRWVNEGFAQTYSNLVLDEIGGKARRPEKVKPRGPGGQPLNEWDQPSFRDDDQTSIEERYGYNAAWYVIDAITDDIGTDKMREVIAAAADGRYTYLGDPDPEHLTGGTTWRQLLDLVDNTGGAQSATRLFKRFVATTRQVELLEDRAEARRDYDRLVQAGDGWSVPRTIREDMSLWGFATAREEMQTAREILKVRDRIETTLEGTSIDLPSPLEAEYEGKVKDLDEVLAHAQEHLEVAERLAAAAAAADEGHGLFGTIGLIGDDYRGELDAAADAFSDGDGDAARRGADGVLATIDDAPGVGQVRTAGAVGIVVVLLAIGLGLRARRRRRAARASAALTDPTPAEPTATDTAPADTAPAEAVEAAEAERDLDQVAEPPPEPPSPTGGEPLLEPPHPA
jgi:hypothetical protein